MTNKEEKMYKIMKKQQKKYMAAIVTKAEVSFSTTTDPWLIKTHVI